MRGPLRTCWSTGALPTPSLVFQGCRYGKASVLGLLASGIPAPALPMLVIPSRHGRTISTLGNYQDWLCPALLLKQQVVSSCLRCCTFKSSPPVGLLLPCPSTTPSPLTQGYSSPTPGQGLAFTSGILFLRMRGLLGFLAASYLVVLPPPPPQGWRGAGKEHP